MKRFLLLTLLAFSLSISMTSQHLNHGYIEVSGARQKFPRKIPTGDLRGSVNFARDVVNRLHRLEKSLNWSDIRIRHDTPEHANFIESMPDLKALEQGKHAYITSHATAHLKHKHCRRLKLTEDDCLQFLSGHKLHETKLSPSCVEKNRVCSDRNVYAKYRAVDGACNHPSNAVAGESRTSYRRIAGPAYLDGVERVRNSVTKSRLPSARKISTELFGNDSDISGEYTLNLMEWTEFVLHDMSHTAMRKMVHSREKITCCAEDGSNLSPRYEHPFCLPIEIPEDDDFYSNYGVSCISYVRSLPSIKDDCSLGALEQLNQATHYLDGSQIYGNSRKKSESLRTFKDGLLQSQVINGEVFLPYSTNKEDCTNPGQGKCFKGGDPRINSQPLLTTLHTVFLREHNRIAETLKRLNPHWNDDILFEESRRVVVAELQHITYNEWLPIVLGDRGRKAVSYHKADDFQEAVDPRVSNSFATAAMRFSKSLVDSNIELHDENRAENVTFKLRDIFHRPSVIEDNLDGFLVALSTQGGQKMDLNVPDDIKNHLYGKGDYGLDVMSLDIQRGRDHGLPGYTTYRKLCGLGRVETFKDLIPLIPEKTVRILSELYKDPRDIDLLVGGFSERALGDGILGPTFSCIILDQFLRTKHGDRYFYSHVNQPKPFVSGQLKEVQRTTLASVLCANGNVEKLQRNVFKTINHRNRLYDCSEIPQVNFEYWKESM